MYFTGDAKLWWRTWLDDGVNAGTLGRPTIETWVEFLEMD
jgi:hypothetical protein